MGQQLVKNMLLTTRVLLTPQRRAMLPAAPMRRADDARLGIKTMSPCRSHIWYLFSPLQERGAGRLCVNGLERIDERELAFRNVPQAPSSAREHTAHRATQIRGD